MRRERACARADADGVWDGVCRARRHGQDCPSSREATGDGHVRGQGSVMPGRAVAYGHRPGTQCVSGRDVLPDASSISSCAFVRSSIASSFSARAPAISSPTRG